MANLSPRKYAYEIGDLLLKNKTAYASCPPNLLVLEQQMPTSHYLAGYKCMILPEGNIQEYSVVHIEKHYHKVS